MIRHSIVLLVLLAIPAARAADVSLIGTFDTKAAILSIDSGAPKTVKVGQTFGGVTLISVERDRATIESGGKRRVLVRGQTYSTSAPGADRQSVTMSAGAGDHYFVDGQINGGAIRFLVDTGASAVAIPAREADRLGIDYRKGRRGTTQTAGGPTPMHLVRLDSIGIGGIELRNIDAIVIENGLDVALLGMSFLSRVDMKQDRRGLTIMRRY